jgi:hypothetical protein
MFINTCKSADNIYGITCSKVSIWTPLSIRAFKVSMSTQGSSVQDHWTVNRFQNSWPFWSSTTAPAVCYRFPTIKLGCSPSVVKGAFMVDKVALGLLSLQVRPFPFVSIIPPTRHIIFIHLSSTLYSRGDQLDGICKPHFRRQLWQEPRINLLKPSGNFMYRQV